MIPLRPAQICVIDDDPNEYQKLIEILNKLGLGCVHIAGETIESLPERPIDGFRLVFLDLHLGEVEAGKTAAAKTANVFARSIAIDSAPVLVAVWSKFPEEIDGFRAALFEARPEFCGRLIFLLLAQKPMDASDGNIDEIKKAVNGLLAGAFPLDILWAWEYLAHDSISKTSAELCRLAIQRTTLRPTDDKDVERAKVLSGLRGILRALALAEASDALSKDSVASDLMRMLSSLQIDRLEHSPAGKMPDSVKIIAEAGGTDPDQAGKVSLNSMLLIGQPETDGAAFRPGTVYVIQDRGGFETLTSLPLLELQKAIFYKPLGMLNCIAFWWWRRNCIPFLVEISPTCDFAVQKRPLSRLVAGLFIPEYWMKYAKQKSPDGALRSIVGVNIPGIDKVVHPFLCAGFSMSLAPDKHPAFLRPVARFKEPLLSDLRSWVVSQAARIGFPYLT